MRQIQKKPTAIDLNPHEWRSGRPKRREPILGPGAGYLFGELAMIAAGFGLLIVVALLGVYLKGTVYNLLYGESSSGVHSSVPPGDYTWTPESGLKRSSASISPPR